MVALKVALCDRYLRDGVDVTIDRMPMRYAFFARGKGKLNPLSAKSIIECCIMPILSYGSESWILNSWLGFSYRFVAYRTVYGGRRNAHNHV